MTKIIAALMIVMLALAVLPVKTAHAAARVASVTGSWNNTATWGGLSVPVAVDDVTINSNVIVTIPSGYSAQCATINFTNGAAGAAAINLADATASLTVSGAVTIQRQGVGGSSNTIDVGAGTFSAASVDLQATAGAARLSQILISTGTASISGNITSAGTASRITFSGAGTLNAGGTFMSGAAGTFTANTGTVNFNGGAQSIAPFAYTFNNVTLSGSGAKTLTNATINGNLSLSGTATATTVAAMTIGGNLVIGDGTTFTAAGFALTVTGTITVGGGTSGNLTISSATGAKIFVGLVTINAGATWNNTGNSAVIFRGGITNNATGTFTAGTGVHTFNTNSQALTGTFSIPSVTVAGAAVTLTSNNTLTVGTALIGSGGLIQTASSTLNIGGTSGITTLTATAVGNTVNYNGTGAQTVRAVNYYNLTISGARAGANNVTLAAGTIGVANTFSPTATFGTGGYVTAGNTVNFNGAGAQTIPAFNYNNLSTSNGGTKTSGGAITVSSNLMVGDGTTFSHGAYALTVTGTTTIGSGTSGNLTISSATGAKIFVGLVTINAGATWNNSGNSDVTFRSGISKNATGTFTAGTGVHTFDTNSQALTGTFSIPSVTVTGVTLTNNNTLTVGTALSGTGGLTNSATGTLNLSGTSGITTLTATAVGNTVNYTGAAQTVHTGNYYNLGLSGSGAKTLAVGTTAIGGNLTLSGTATTTTVVGLTIGGNLVIGNGTTFTAAGFALTVTGTTTVGGGTSGNLTISSATGVKIFTGLVAVNNGATWNNSGNSAVIFRGGITNNATGTFTAGTGVHTFNTNSQALTGTFSIPSVTVTGVTLTNNNTLTVGTALSGTGGLTNSATGTLNLGGTSGITTLTATAVGNTVNYNAAGAQTVNATAYSNLNLSNSGAKAIATGTSVGGNIDISGALANIGAGLIINVNSLSLGGVGRASGTWGSTTSPATHTNNTYFSATTGMLNVATNTGPDTTVGDGTTPASKFVKGSDTNKAVSAFTLVTSSGTDTITALTVTGSGTGLANVAALGVKLWLDNGSIPSEWDATDTAVGTGVTFSGTTASFSGLSIPVTTTATQYLITYDIITSPTNAQTMLAAVTSVTTTNTVTNNDNTDATLTVDTVAPTVTFDLQAGSDSGISNTDNITNVASPVFDAIFSEVVAGFAAGDLSNTGTATGCTFAMGGPTGNTYPVTVTLCTEGTLIVRMAASGVTDTAGNNIAQTDGPTVTIDRTVPTVTINQAGGQADPTNSSPIDFTVVFNEDTTDFATGDVTLSGTAGATTATVSGSGTTYNVAVSGMAGDGTVIADVAAGVATDAAGNANTDGTSTDNTVTYDTTSPTVTINRAGGQADPTNSSPIDFTVVFNEDTTDFATGDVTLSGTAGATTATVSGSGTTYNVAVSGMAGDGTVIADVAAGVATDAAGNANTDGTSTDNTVTYDTTSPMVTFDLQAGSDSGISNTDNITNVASPVFDAIFSEVVAGFAAGDSPTQARRPGVHLRWVGQLETPTRSQSPYVRRER